MSNLPPPPPSPLAPKPLDPRVGVALRLAFYILIGFTGFVLIPALLLALVGPIVASTVGLFTVGIITNFLTLRIFDRLSLAAIGLGTAPGSGRNFVLGILFGGGSAALMLVAPLLAGTGHFERRPDGIFHWSSLLFYLVVLLFGAAGEEILFRGYAFQLLIEKIGPWATILPVAVLFGLGHLSNPNAISLGILNTALWGALLGYAFLRSHDLWLLIGLHYGWNAVLPLFGVNLSGLTIEITRYYYKWDLGPLWSGGAYGPEGGLLTTIFVGMLFYLLVRAPVVQARSLLAPSLNVPD